MQHSYYIAQDNAKDGPHDLVSIMRRIHAKKITSDTLIYIDDAEAALPAAQIPDIALFFTHEASVNTPQRLSSEPNVRDSIIFGWNFMLEHNIMTVFSGALLLTSLLLAVNFINMFGAMVGCMLAWCIFIIFHHTYLLFILRLYRGQNVGSDFINLQISPVLPTLLLSYVVLALMMAGGLLLLIVPGIAVMVIYLFVPFLILDRRYRMVEAMHASRLLLQKHGPKNVIHIACLNVVHLICLLLIIPIPLTLPIFAAAISRAYDDLSAS